MADSSDIPAPAAKPGRRSQAERTAETRAKIIEAVVDCIADVGFQRTTANTITERAGVTWGAVQHHFGSKDGMLIAVLDDSFDRFAARLEDIPAEATLAERAGLFVDRAWEHFRSRHYRATFEILLNYLSRDHVKTGVTWQEHMTRAWDAVWASIFADAALGRRRMLMLQHYTVSVLSGLASTLTLEGGDATLPRDELALLKATLVRELANRE